MYCTRRFLKVIGAAKQGVEGGAVETFPDE
jgi:hypothetical protein